MARVDSASRRIHASAEEVYAAFADAHAWQHWLPPSGMSGEIVHFEFREGGSYRLALVYADPSIEGKSGENRDITSGTFVELVPDRRMVQLVEFTSDDPEFSGTMRMTWSIEPDGDGCTVTITAENVPPGILPEDHAEGMHSTLENLDRFLSCGF